MAARRARLHGAIFAVLLLGGASGCSATVSVGTPPASTGAAPTQAAVPTRQAQTPGTCQIAPPQAHFPTGEWTATATILRTSAIDVCAGERQVRPWDFRRLCHAGNCKTYLYTADYYGVVAATVVADGPGRYIGTFRPETVPCPHRPGEDAGTNQVLGTITLWWSSDKQTLHGLSRVNQVGACGGNPPETASYVETRTNPTANPPAEGP
jgi:hypothetical protein